MSLISLKKRFNRFSRAGAHVLKANIYNRLSLTAMPYAAHFIPTWRCNLKCSSCGVWKRLPGEELSGGQIISLLPMFKSLDVIKIVGGEPFLRDDLKDIVSCIRDRIDPFITQIVTNGYLSEKIIDLAEKVGYEAVHFRVSLDGLGKRHDCSRGVDGAFDKALETLEGLSRLRVRKKFGLGVNYNVTDDTLEDMEDVYSLCLRLKADFVPGVPVTPFLEDRAASGVKHKIVNLSDISGFVSRYHGLRRRLGVYPGRILRDKLNDGIFRRMSLGSIAPFGCRQLRNLVYIHPDGSIVTCGLRHKRVADLKKEPLERIWSSGEIKEARKEVDSCPGCLQSAVEMLSRIYYCRFSG